MRILVQQFDGTSVAALEGAFSAWAEGDAGSAAREVHALVPRDPD